MPFSAGVFARLYNWVQDKQNSIKIIAARLDAEFDGVATGLSTTICRDGQSTIIADIPWNSFKITGLGNGTNALDAVNWQQLGYGYLAAEVDLASATTTDIGAQNSTRVNITGTTAITSLGTVANRVRFLRFAGALTLTHNATTLILPGNTNITTAAGDTAVATSDASGNWTVRHYQRRTGKSLIGPGALDITDATTVGVGVLTAADAATARSVLGGVLYPSAQFQTQNGYFQFSNGVMIQWGLNAPGAGVDRTVSFPMTWPNICWSVVAIVRNGATSNTTQYGVSCVINSTSNFTIRPRYNASGTIGIAGEDVFWIAIGN